MIAKYLSDRSRDAYSLVEVMVAAAILALAVTASGGMGYAISVQRFNNARIAIALNYQEQAARLYHLGLPVAAIPSILPAEPSISSLEFLTPQTVSVPGIGSVERVECRVVFPIRRSRDGSAVGATNSIVLVRPTIR